MLKRATLIVLAVMAGNPAFAAEHTVSKEPITWRAWSPEVFKEAAASGRFVLLDLGAVWCHWCHVMESVTYRDEAVTKLIGDRYIAVRVDQDQNPELANRYEDYGWPATVIFLPDGSELVRRRGYINPSAMASMLRAVIADPTPGPSVTPDETPTSVERGVLTEATVQELESRIEVLYDPKFGGWGSIHKYVQPETMELTLSRALAGDVSARRRAEQTLSASLALVDPVWGGVYQYSDLRNPQAPWSSPHYEKIMWFQTEHVRLYARAANILNRKDLLEASTSIARYLDQFLSSPDGGFYASQDADVSETVTGATYFALDDQARRKLGMPRIDTHVYARENGWAIGALAALADATGDATHLTRARRAAEWTVEHRGLPGGGFRHGEDKSVHLGDTLAMGRAFLALYSSTGEVEYLGRASQALAFMDANFRAQDSGFVTARPDHDAIGVLKTPVKQVDENVMFARFANLLFHHTGKVSQRDLRDHAMRFLASPSVVGKKRLLTGVLLAHQEQTKSPLHVTIVGAKDDPAARALFDAARAYPSAFKRVEWWDPSGPRLPHHDIEYPKLPFAAAFACDRGACSIPLKDANNLRVQLDRLGRR